MKYSYNWIQTHILETLPPLEEMKEKIIFHAFEVEDVETVGGDAVMDIKVLPDRAGDCLSHFGMAREIAGLFGLTLKASNGALPAVSEPYPVKVESLLCKRYMAVKIQGVVVGPSPGWLTERLEALGQKSINNIVDATNFVLLDSGQPTHAFDADRIVGNIVVRMAHDGEGVTTLSGEEKVLSPADLVIADDSGVLAIAGVKGGKRAEVTENTKNIVLEIANFDAASVRKTSRRIALATDASKRFENNLSPVGVVDAAAQLVALITDIAGGNVVAMTDHYPKPEIIRTIDFSLSDIVRILGNGITGKKIAEVFDRYHYEYTFEDGMCMLTVPHYRADITGAHDIAEEVCRVMGYDTIPALPLPFVPTRVENSVDQSIDAVKKYLINKGFSEVMTYTFCKAGDLSVSYGARGKNALRTNLLDGLKESFMLNKQHAPLLHTGEVRVFEIGTVFFSDNEEMHVATVDHSGAHESRLADFVQANNINANDLRLQVVSTTTLFKPWSTYPFIVRDVAVWLPEGDAQVRAALEKMITDFAQKHAVNKAVMFDTFVKEGRVSYAYRFVFQSATKTLTDDEVSATIAPLYDSIRSILGAELR